MSAIVEIPITMRATTSMKAHHEINLTLEKGYAVAPSSPSSPIIMAVGETVRYSSDAGEVRILFKQQSPFRIDDVTETYVPGSVILTLLSGSMAVSSWAIALSSLQVNRRLDMIQTRVEVCITG